MHVALATNIGTETNLLESLAGKIALAVPAANVPSSYNLWMFKVAIPTQGKLKTDK